MDSQSKIRTPNIWISWHLSRRSRTLSQALGLKFIGKQVEGLLVYRHGLSALWTVIVLLRYRPKVVFLQYSFLLLLIVAFYKDLTNRRVRIVCDCHNKALKKRLSGPMGKIFDYFKRYSLRSSDLLIISNPGLNDLASTYNDNVIIQPDLIPTLDYLYEVPCASEYCVFVMSYAEDEPIDVVLDALPALEKEIKVFLTGNPPDVVSARHTQYRNVIFTGFLPEDEYNNLLANASCVVALTTDNNCIQCSCYEALSLKVPLVTSGTSAQREYFKDAAIYIDNDRDSLVNGIRKAVGQDAFIKSRQTDLIERYSEIEKRSIVELNKLMTCQAGCSE